MKKPIKKATMIPAAYPQKYTSVLGAVPFLICSMRDTSSGKFPMKTEIPLTKEYAPTSEVAPMEMMTPRKQERIPHPREQAPITIQNRALDSAYLNTALLRMRAMQRPANAARMNRPPFLNFIKA